MRLRSISLISVDALEPMPCGRQPGVSSRGAVGSALPVPAGPGGVRSHPQCCDDGSG